MNNKAWTTNHGTPLPFAATVVFGYRILEFHMEGDVKVIDKAEMVSSTIYDGTLGPNGPQVLHHREGETDHAFATRLVRALEERGQGSEWQ